jgi:hypothetical protein
LVEGPAPRRSEGSGDGWRFSDRAYSGSPFKAPDGTIINSKKSHREYMKRTGFTTADDFTQTWSKAKQERESYYKGEHKGVRREIREDIHRAVEKLSSK